MGGCWVPLGSLCEPEGELVCTGIMTDWSCPEEAEDMCGKQ